MQVYKIDNNYIILKEDAPIPALGEKFYYPTPGAALRALAEEVADHEPEGANPSDIHIAPNQWADAELIRSYGFSAR